jgi:hypothetical protein
VRPVPTLITVEVDQCPLKTVELVAFVEELGHVRQWAAIRGAAAGRRDERENNWLKAVDKVIEASDDGGIAVNLVESDVQVMASAGVHFAVQRPQNFKCLRNHSLIVRQPLEDAGLDFQWAPDDPCNPRFTSDGRVSLDHNVRLRRQWHVGVAAIASPDSVGGQDAGDLPLDVQSAALTDLGNRTFKLRTQSANGKVDS